MKKQSVSDFESQIDQAIAENAKAHFVLRLYVAGTSPRSTAAVSNIKRICEKFLKGRYELEVIDLFQRPDMARSGQIIAAPTLIKTLPEPIKRLIGDLSNEEQVLISLNIKDPVDPPRARDEQP